VMALSLKPGDVRKFVMKADASAEIESLVLLYAYAADALDGIAATRVKAEGPGGRLGASAPRYCPA